MKTDFLKTHRVVITPLSFIHIGTGEEYDPSSYVVKDKLLYQFSADNVRLGSVRREILEAADDYRRLNRILSKRADLFIPWADAVLPLDKGCHDAYSKMIDPQGNQKPTLMQLAKTAAVVKGGRSEPYIPGSSIKGAVATALRSRINGGHPLKPDRYVKESDRGKVLGEMAKNLIGDFANSPLRFLKISDCMASNRLLKTCGRYAMRFFKGSEGYCGVSSCFESIDPGQYRAFEGEAVFTGGQNQDGVRDVYPDAFGVAEDLHRYAMDVWLSEKGLYRKADPVWTDSVERLLSSLDKEIENRRICLVRIGKNAGAESKVLHGESVAEIKIIHPRAPRDSRGKIVSETKDHTTTAWFTAGEGRSVDGKAAVSGLPYGWALIEFDPQGENAVLKDWCSCQSKRFSCADIKTLWDEVDRRKKELDQKAREEENRLAEERKKAEREEAEQKAREERLSRMSAEQQRIEMLKAKLSASGVRANPGTQLFAEIKKAVEEALQWESEADKKLFASELGRLMKEKGAYEGKGKDLKKNIRTLSGEPS